MTLRKITIGRSPYSDIFLDSRCVYASFHHGEIYSDGNQMIYRDISTNGTLINRFFVRHRCVSLSRGDIILIAGRYLLDWNQIDHILPRLAYKTSFLNSSKPLLSLTGSGVADTSKWNWGAMGLYPIWGFYNGCPWAILVALCAWYLFPIPNLFFGYFGNRLARHTRYWVSNEEFQYEQYRWKKYGVAAMCVFGVIFLWWISIYVKYILNQ